MNTTNLSRESLLQLLDKDKKSLASIKTQLASCAEEYDALNNAGQGELLDVVKQRINSLTTEYGVLNNAILERRAAHASRCMMPDILANIFRYAILLLEASTILPSSWAYNLSQETLPSDVPPVNLLKVCREWRHIALSLPILWSLICIMPDSLEGLHRAESRVKTWLDRAPWAVDLG